MPTTLEAQKVCVRDRGGKELSVLVGLECVIQGVDHQGRDSDPGDARAWYPPSMVKNRTCIAQRGRIHPVDEVPDLPVLLGAEAVYHSLRYSHEPHDLPLEQSLELFERGVHLSRECQKRLDEAERKVEILVKGDDGKATALPFEEPEEL